MKNSRKHNDAGRLTAFALPVGGWARGTEQLNALVDREDFEGLMVYRWTIGKAAGGIFAMRSERLGNGVKRTVTLHRQILGLDPSDTRRVEHINGDKMDCRKANLRIYEPKLPPAAPVEMRPKPDGPCIQVGGNRPRRHGRPSVIAWARVDLENLERFSIHNWSLMGRRDGKGIAVRRERQDDGTYRQVQMHREVMDLDPGEHRVVDHINGDSLDNRRENLRLATTAENAQNRQGPNRGREDGAILGVREDRRYTLPWSVHLRFPTQEEAAKWVARYRAEFMPFSKEGDGRA